MSKELFLEQHAYWDCSCCTSGDCCCILLQRSVSDRRRWKLDRRRWKRGQYADAVLVFCVYVPLLHSAQSGTTREVTAEHGEVWYTQSYSQKILAGDDNWRKQLCKLIFGNDILYLIYYYAIPDWLVVSKPSQHVMGAVMTNSIF